MGSIIEELEKYPTEGEKIIMLSREIEKAISEMFYNVREPRGIEITFYGGVKRKIYTPQFAKNIARHLLGGEVKKYKGETWKDAQERMIMDR